MSFCKLSNTRMAKIKTQLVKRKQKKDLILEKPKPDEEYFSELDSDESLDSDQEVSKLPVHLIGFLLLSPIVFCYFCRAASASIPAKAIDTRFECDQ